MPGIHKNPTMSFRPSKWEREQIEGRILASGMGKAKYITHACIYNNVCVVGRKELIAVLIRKMIDMEQKLTDLSENIHNSDLSDIQEIKDEYLGVVDGMLWMLKGAEYMFKEEKK